MSTTVYALNVYGVRVNKSAFQKRIKTFDHDYPSNWGYDPKTGKQLWEDNNLLVDLAGRKFDGYEVNIYGNNYDSDEMIVGLVLNQTEYDGGIVRIDLQSITNIALAAKRFLQENNIKIDDSFGLYTICRYN